MHHMRPAAVLCTILLAWLAVWTLLPPDGFAQFNGCRYGFCPGSIGSSGGGPAQAPLRIAANRGITPNNTRVANAANLMCGETRMSMFTGNGDLSELRFVYAGFYLLPNSGVETNAGNDETVEMAIEWPGKSTQRVTFGGQATGTIVNGIAEYVSDPLYPAAFGLSTFPKNTQFWVRSRRQVALNGTHAKHGGSGSSGEATFYSDCSSASQVMGSGVMTQPTGGATAVAELGPAAIIGRFVGPAPVSVVLIGDSIDDGNNDNNIASSGAAGGGYNARGLYNVTAQIPWMKQTVGGSTAQNMAAGLTKRSAYWKYATHAFVGYGTNDMAVVSRTAAQTLGDLRTIWTALKAAGVKRVEQRLIIPRTTSTDTFMTTANQTPVTGFETGGVRRDALNSSIQANVGANGLDDYLNFGSATSDPTLPDRWAVTGAANYATIDGTHPTPAIAALMGPVFAARAATWN